MDMSILAVFDSDPLTILKEYGPLLGAVIFFIWRDWDREGKLSKRIVHLETEMRDVVIPLVRNVTEALTRNTDEMAQSRAVMEDAKGAIRDLKVCMEKQR